MNKFYFLALALIFGANSTINAQEPNPTFENPSFENWTSGMPNGWTSLNYATPVNEDGIPMLAVEQVTTGASDGTSYLKTTSYNVMNSTNPIEFPNGVYGSYVYQEFSSTTKHLKFTLDVNYNLQPNDTAVIMISAIDVNKYVIGQGLKRYGGTQSDLSPEVIALTYSIFFPGPVHSYVVGIASSETRALGSLYTSTAEIGSWIGIDNIRPSGILSVPKQDLADSKINIFPNPANDIVNFNLDELNDGSITINSITGQEVANVVVTNSIEQVNVSHLSNGFYIYTVRNLGGTIVKTGKLIIRK